MANTVSSFRFSPPADLPIAKSATEYAFVNKFKNPPGYGAVRDPLPLLEKVKQAAYVVFATLLFIFSYNVFTFGFICGIVWDETCHAAIGKINSWLSQQNWWTWSLVIGPGTFIAFPPVYLTTSFLVGASLGGRSFQQLKFD